MKQMIKLFKINTYISMPLIAPLFLFFDADNSFLDSHTAFLILSITFFCFIFLAPTALSVPVFGSLCKVIKNIVLFALKVQPKVKKVKEKRNLWGASLYYYLYLLMIIPLLIGVALTSQWTTNDIIYFAVGILLVISQLSYLVYLYKHHNQVLREVLTFKLYFEQKKQLEIIK